MHRADEPHPVLVVGETTGDAGMSGQQEDHDEDSERDAGDQQREPGPVDVDQRRPCGEPEAHEDRKRDEPGQALEHDRTERDRRGVHRRRRAADAQDVAADRRRQDVADEQAREVVADQRPEPHVDVEHVQDALPAPRGENDAEQGGEQRRGEQQRREQMMVVGQQLLGVGRLGDEHTEEGDAHEDACPELPPRCRPGDDRSLATHDGTAYVRGQGFPGPQLAAHESHAAVWRASSDA